MSFHSTVKRPQATLFGLAILLAGGVRAQEPGEASERAEINVLELSREGEAPPPASRTIHAPLRAAPVFPAPSVPAEAAQSPAPFPGAAPGFSGFAALLDDGRRTPPDSYGAVGPPARGRHAQLGVPGAGPHRRRQGPHDAREVLVEARPGRRGRGLRPPGALRPRRPPLDRGGRPGSRIAVLRPAGGRLRHRRPHRQLVPLPLRRHLRRQLGRLPHRRLLRQLGGRLDEPVQRRHLRPHQPLRLSQNRALRRRSRAVHAVHRHPGAVRAGERLRRPPGPHVPAPERAELQRRGFPAAERDPRRGIFRGTLQHHRQRCLVLFRAGQRGFRPATGLGRAPGHRRRAPSKLRAPPGLHLVRPHDFSAFGRPHPLRRAVVAAQPRPPRRWCSAGGWTIPPAPRFTPILRSR